MLLPQGVMIPTGNQSFYLNEPTQNNLLQVYPEARLPVTLTHRDVGVREVIRTYPPCQLTQGQTSYEVMGLGGM